MSADKESTLAAPLGRPNPSQAAADAIPILVDDTYHLFHLTTPPDTVHHPPRLRSSWSRLRSKDLVHWTRDPSPVVSPGPEEDEAPDASGAWTGSAVLGPDGKMNIFYTGYSLARGGKQVVLRMRGRDAHGDSFEPGREQIKIVGDMSRFEDIDFRDPYIFFNDSVGGEAEAEAEAATTTTTAPTEKEKKKKKGEYLMLVATRLRHRPHWTAGCIALLTSPDLDTWHVDPDPLYAPNDMFCPECPELFPLSSNSNNSGKTLWYLVYSRFAAPNPGTVYRVADSPRGPFRTPRGDGSGGRFDGRRWYAAKSCPVVTAPGDKRVYFGWIADRCEDDGKWLWGGDLAVPREVSAREDGTLRVEPVRAAVAAMAGGGGGGGGGWMQKKQTQRRREVVALEQVGSTAVTVPECLAGLGKTAQQQGEMVMEMGIVESDCASFGLLLSVGEDMAAHYLRFIASGDGKHWAVTLVTDQVPLDDFWADQYSLYFPRGVDGPEFARHDRVCIDSRIQLILRGQLVECFVGGKSISFRLPLHAIEKEQKRVALFVEDGTVKLDLSVRAA